MCESSSASRRPKKQRAALWRPLVESQAFAKGKNIVIIDGPHLTGMIRETRQMQQATPVVEATSSDILCPKCGEAKKRRETKQGGGAGNAFWGCKSFPRCRGTRPIN